MTRQLELMSELTLKNKKTGETETFELCDEKARQQLQEKASKEELRALSNSLNDSIDRKADNATIDILGKELDKKAYNSTVDSLDKKLDKTIEKLDQEISRDTTKGIKIVGTTLKIVGTTLIITV